MLELKLELESPLTCPPVLDQLDTAAVALLGVRHVPGVGREHEGVAAPRVVIGVTVETLGLFTS